MGSANKVCFLHFSLLITYSDMKKPPRYPNRGLGAVEKVHYTPERSLSSLTLKQHPTHWIESLPLLAGIVLQDLKQQSNNAGIPNQCRSSSIRHVYLATGEIKTTDIFMSIQPSSQTDTLGIWAINGAQHGGDSSDSSKEELLEYYRLMKR